MNSQARALLVVLALAGALGAVLVGVRHPSASGRARVGEPAPALGSVERWVNSEPLSLEKLRGKVVLLDVWAVW